jgi:hypothetical protein
MTHMVQINARNVERSKVIVKLTSKFVFEDEVKGKGNPVTGPGGPIG